MSSKKTEVGASTWLVIGLIVASVAFEAVDALTRGSFFTWLGAACFAAALAIIVVTVRKDKRG